MMGVSLEQGRIESDKKGKPWIKSSWAFKPCKLQRQQQRSWRWLGILFGDLDSSQFRFGTFSQFDIALCDQCGWMFTCRNDVRRRIKAQVFYISLWCILFTLNSCCLLPCCHEIKESHHCLGHISCYITIFTSWPIHVTKYSRKWRHLINPEICVAKATMKIFERNDMRRPMWACSCCPAQTGDMLIRRVGSLDKSNSCICVANATRYLIGEMIRRGRCSPG